MTLIQPTMLWESSDANAALTRRFQFASSADAARWFIDTLDREYGMRVDAVDRLVISSANLIAWLTTDAGPLIAKCCALVSHHERLLTIAALLQWLEQQGIPVSAPLLTSTGAGQIRCEHLSLGVQRVITGELLEPTQLAQAQVAGVTLAHLHQALAAYPRTADFIPSAPIQPLATIINHWVDQKSATLTAPDLSAGLNVIRQRLQTISEGTLVTQLVHNDYRAANLLWHDNKIAAILDFEELSWGYRIQDLAQATIHLGTRFHNWGPVAREVHTAFLESYATIQPLTATEQAWLPLLLTMQSINLVGPANSPQYANSMGSVNTYRRLLEAELT